LVSTGTYIILTNEESGDYVENVSEYIWLDWLLDTVVGWWIWTTTAEPFFRAVRHWVNLLSF
jgi:hypothetical protein